jgi:hypothetical protein
MVGPNISSVVCHILWDHSSLPFLRRSRTLLPTKAPTSSVPPSLVLCVAAPSFHASFGGGTAAFEAAAGVLVCVLGSLSARLLGGASESLPAGRLWASSLHVAAASSCDAIAGGMASGETVEGGCDGTDVGDAP